MQSADNVPGKNHPLAFRMGVIAFLSQSLVLACLYGTFGLLLAPVEKKFGVGRDISSLAFPLISLGTAIIAPLVGSLANKVSLKAMMIVGCVMTTLGFILLAFADRVEVYLFAYCALIGPGMVLNAMLLPSTLVTRWFKYNRGRALGFVHAPVTMVLLPLAANFVLQGYGLSAVYSMLAVIMGLLLIPVFFVVDFPPDAETPAETKSAAAAATEPGLTTMQLLGKPAFWGLTMGAAAIIAGAVMLGAHLAPMVMGWGLSSTSAALLMTLSALASVAGTIGFGWLADKIGGRLMLAIMCANSVVLWMALTLHPPFVLLAVLVGLISAHGAAGLPTFGMALSEQFGQLNFGRAFGLGNMSMLPFMLLPVPISAVIFMKTGGYDGGLIAHACLFAFACVMVFFFGGKRIKQPAVAVA